MQATDEQAGGEGASGDWTITVPPGAARRATGMLEDRLWGLGTTGIATLPDGSVIAGFTTRATAEQAAQIVAATDGALDTVVIAPARIDWGDPTEHEVEFAGSTVRIVADTTFGHGRHPTTRACLDLLADLLRPGDHVLDVGSGSGVLAIAATVGGAARAHGLDLDPHTVAVATANAARNAGTTATASDLVRIEHQIPRSSDGLDGAGVDGAGMGGAGAVATFATDALAHEPGPYDLVVANILLADLEPLADDLRRLAADRLVLSGALVEQRDRLVAVAGPDLQVVDTREHDGWLAIAFRRTSPDHRTEPTGTDR